MDSGAGYISAVTCQTTGVFLFLCEIKILMLTVSVYHKSLTITPTNSSAVPLLFLRLTICAHVRFTDHFPGEPELASSLVLLPPLVLEENLWVKWWRFYSQMPFLSYGHPTNSVKALKETQSTDANQWPGIILFSSTTRLPMEGVLFPLCRLCGSLS